MLQERNMSDFWRQDKTDDRVSELASVLRGSDSLIGVMGSGVRATWSTNGQSVTWWIRTRDDMPQEMRVYLDYSPLAQLEPPFAGTAVDEVIGYAAHEGGHCLFSSGSATQEVTQIMERSSNPKVREASRYPDRIKKVLRVANIIEDAFIDFHVAEHWPVLGEYIRISRNKIAERRPIDLDTISLDTNPSYNQMLNLWIACSLYDADLPDKMRAKVKRALTFLMDKSVTAIKTRNSNLRLQMSVECWEYLMTNFQERDDPLPRQPEPSQPEPPPEKPEETKDDETQDTSGSGTDSESQDDGEDAGDDEESQGSGDGSGEDQDEESESQDEAGSGSGEDAGDEEESQESGDEESEGQDEAGSGDDEDAGDEEETVETSGGEEDEESEDVAESEDETEGDGQSGEQETEDEDGVETEADGSGQAGEQGDDTTEDADSSGESEQGGDEQGEPGSLDEFDARDIEGVPDEVLEKVMDAIVHEIEDLSQSAGEVLGNPLPLNTILSRKADFDATAARSVRDSVESEIQAMRRVFDRQAAVQSRDLKGLTVGKLDSRNLSRVGAGNFRVYKKRQILGKPDLAVGLLLDVSGSLQVPTDYMPYVWATGCVFAEGLIRKQGVNFTALTYTGSMWQVQMTRICDRAMGQYCLGNVAIGGGTPSGEALASMKVLMDRMPEKTKVIIHFTDGRPDNSHSVVTAVEALRKAGYTVWAISLHTFASMLGRQYGEGNYETIGSVRDLPGKVANLVARLGASR